MNGFFGVVRGQILIPLALPIALVLLAVILRSVRALWFRLKQRGFPPIVIHAASDPQSRAFAAQLSEYLARETPGPALIIPPGSGPLPPPVPIEQLSTGGGWLAALIRVVLSREPAFEVYVERPGQEPAEIVQSGYRSIIRVTRVPGNRVLAADRLQDKDEAQLIGAAGCLVIHNVRQQPGIVRHTARWERWSNDIEGYSTYRRALDLERQGQSDSALESYDRALRYEPANFLINVRKATILEAQGKFKEAWEVYRTCQELWPEHIATAYRLAASYVNGGNYGASEGPLEVIKHRLNRWVLWGEIGKTWWLTRWNVGERRYWTSWSRRHPRIIGSNNRHYFRMAVGVAEQVRDLGRLIPPAQAGRRSIDDLVSEMANLTRRGAFRSRMARMVTRRTLTSPYVRLFHPERLMLNESAGGQHEIDQADPSHDKIDQADPSRRPPRPADDQGDHVSSWHNKDDDSSLVMYSKELSRLPKRLRPRKRIGWLAHYNAACFYSLALRLEQPPGCYHHEIDEWKIDCARAAIRELGHVRRDPLSEIEPDWYEHDPELDPLRNYFKGTRWAKLVGLK